MNETTALITEYLRALSGRSKPSDLVQKYVADPALAQHIAEVEAAFPNYEIVVQDTVAERDLVVVRGTFHGTHRGPFAGIDPTGNVVSAGLIIIYRIENGRIAQHWMQFDRLALIQQLQGTATAVPA
jgi:predicted ester cyclase